MLIRAKENSKILDGWGVEPGKVYVVYQLVFSDGESPNVCFGIYENLLPNYGTLDEFDIVSEKLPSTWGLYYYSERNYYFLCPKKWGDDSLWEYSFWEDFYNAETEEAIKCYEEETAIMEREGMQEMIELGLIEEELEQ